MSTVARMLFAKYACVNHAIDGGFAQCGCDYAICGKKSRGSDSEGCTNRREYQTAYARFSAARPNFKNTGSKSPI